MRHSGALEDSKKYEETEKTIVRLVAVCSWPISRGKIVKQRLLQPALPKTGKQMLEQKQNIGGALTIQNAIGGSGHSIRDNKPC